MNNLELTVVRKRSPRWHEDSNENPSSSEMGLEFITVYRWRRVKTHSSKCVERMFLMSRLLITVLGWASGQCLWLQQVPVSGWDYTLKEGCELFGEVQVFKVSMFMWSHPQQQKIHKCRTSVVNTTCPWSTGSQSSVCINALHSYGLYWLLWATCI